MRTVTLAGGESVPALGLGTWRMGEKRGERAAETKALQLGLELGFRLIDTAEMYGEGGAEEIVGEAIAGRRDQVYLVTKAYPQNASRKRMLEACARSLKRLGTDRIDLYLLHWPGAIPLEQIVNYFSSSLIDKNTVEDVLWDVAKNLIGRLGFEIGRAHV